MGSSISKSLGPRSVYRPDSNANTEIDYRDPVHKERAKRELYGLFLDGKIVHISNFEELQTKMEQSLHEQSRLQKLGNNKPESIKQIANHPQIK